MNLEYAIAVLTVADKRLGKKILRIEKEILARNYSAETETIDALFEERKTLFSRRRSVQKAIQILTGGSDA